MPFDYKKEYKDLYQPSEKPSLIKVPPMSYVAVRGKGDPNEEDDNRRHHEIYLSDPRRVSPERLKTVIRIPVKEA